MRIIGYEMRLKTAISIVETSYLTIVSIALFGMVISFFNLKKERLVIAIVLLLILFIAALFIKIKLINLYLKKGKYPYEFISVLEQLGLTSDLQINWSEDLINGPKKDRLATNEFLEDNKLATDFGVKKVYRPIAVIFLGISILGFAYFNQKFTFKNNPVLLGGFLLLIFIGIYSLIKRRESKNDNEPLLSFKEKGLLVNENLYPWNKMKTWEYKEGGRGSVGKIIISYAANDKEEKITIDLDTIKIDRIDCMLLLTHFKAKYG
jgi:hypothetical protein